MTKEKFLELLSQAKEDEEGRLYIDGDYNNKIHLFLKKLFSKS